MSTMRKLRVEWKHDFNELQSLWREEPNPIGKQRLFALMLLKQGFMLPEVAEIVGIDQLNVRHLASAYQRRGVLHAIGYMAHEDAQLDIKQQRTLVVHAQLKGFSSLPEAISWIERQWGVHYTIASIIKLFERLQIKTEAQMRNSTNRCNRSVQAVMDET